MLNENFIIRKNDVKEFVTPPITNTGSEQRESVSQKFILSLTAGIVSEAILCCYSSAFA